MRILVCEDSAAVRTTVKAALEYAGHEVILAADYADGVYALTTTRLDGVLTDVSYPRYLGASEGPHGIELAQDAAARGVPCILISGQPINLDQHPEAEGIPFLSKPFLLEELLAKVRECWEAVPA